MDTQLLPYRLKTARRKKRLCKKDYDKQAIRFKKEREVLWHAQKNMPKVKLEVPYQRGWKRLLVLKYEIQRSDKAAFYQGILNKITEVQFHYDASFKRPKRKRRYHRYDHPNLPGLKTIDTEEWARNKYQFTDEEQALFKQEVFWDDEHHKWKVRYKFALASLLEVAVKPYMVYEVKQSDTLLEQRLNYIEGHMEHNGMYYRLTKIVGGFYRYRKMDFEKPQYINPLKNKPLYTIVDADF
jgi:hypothetical protein